jgi:hypothetical protein
MRNEITPQSSSRDQVSSVITTAHQLTPHTASDCLLYHLLHVTDQKLYVLINTAVTEYGILLAEHDSYKFLMLYLENH